MNYRTYFRSIFSGKVFIIFYNTFKELFFVCFGLFIKEKEDNFFKIRESEMQKISNSSAINDLNPQGKILNYFK